MMLISEIRERVKKSIARVSGLKVEQIGDKDSFDALELDSLSRIEILVELEREFQLEIPEEQEDENLISEIQTVEHAVEMVCKNLAGSTAV